MIEQIKNVDPGERAREKKERQYLAFQANLLALNALFETARTGKAGAGFSVTAGESKNLARKMIEAQKK